MTRSRLQSLPISAARVSRLTGCEIFGEHRLFLVRRFAVLATNPFHHLHDVPIGAVERLPAWLRARNVGDFRHWKNHDAYKQSFERVLHKMQKTSPSPARTEHPVAPAAMRSRMRVRGQVPIPQVGH